MKKFLCTITFIFMMVVSACAQDDDSTPYMPYPQTPPQPAQPQANTAKKTPAKKKTPARKTSKKTAPKKAAPKKAASRKQTSLEKGIALMQEERYEAAKPYLLKAIQENRNDPSAWYWYGVYHEKTGGFYQAQYFYTKAITIDPAFEPLSRVVYYPNDSEKTPLWDPKRPARVYPVETANNGVIVGQGNFPSAPNDPEVPKVPVYTPPEPASSPLNGDTWAPSVYVPPSPEELQIFEGVSPVYTPPEVGNVIAEAREASYAYKIPGYSSTYANGDKDERVRADSPLYTPPEPGQQKIAQAPKQPAPKAKTVQPKKEKEPKKAASPRKVVKQTEKKKTSAPKATAKPKAQPATPTQTQPRTQPQTQPRTQTRTQTQTPKAPEPQKPTPTPTQPTRPAPTTPRTTPPAAPTPPQQERKQQDYLPPVGQFAPDPGTISETSIPPVGQGSQY